MAVSLLHIAYQPLLDTADLSPSFYSTCPTINVESPPPYCKRSHSTASPFKRSRSSASPFKRSLSSAPIPRRAATSAPRPKRSLTSAPRPKKSLGSLSPPEKPLSESSPEKPLSSESALEKSLSDALSPEKSPRNTPAHKRSLSSVSALKRSLSSAHLPKRSLSSAPPPKRALSNVSTVKSVKSTKSNKSKESPKPIHHVHHIHHHKSSDAYDNVPVFENPCPVCFFKHCRKVLNNWIREQKKPFSAVTVQIDRLTSEQYEENDLGGLVDLIEVVRIQESGPTEAARAIRKKLKYGNPHRQLRALIILDGLIQNAGTRFQKSFADEPLLERLRLLAKDDMVDAEVRQKVNVLFRQWAVAYKGTPGLERIATLYKQLPRTKRPQPQQSRVVRENEAEAERDNASPPSSPTTTRRTAPPSQFPQASSSTGRTVALGAAPLPSSSLFKKDKKDKKNRGKPFNLEKEKHQLLETIASANVASTNLTNGLQLINREVQRVSENPEVMQRFETCKLLRRQILRYIQLVESDQYIGSLLSANDELVKALMAFEIMDKSIDDDSDSDAEEYIPKSAEAAMAGLSIEEAPAKPPRPASIPMPPAPPLGKQKVQSESEPEDDDDPFGDQNAVKTPYERGEPTWRDV